MTDRRCDFRFLCGRAYQAARYFRYLLIQAPRSSLFRLLYSVQA